MAHIVLDDISVFFGKRQKEAILLANEGASRADIKERTDTVLGIHQCNLTVDEGETLVLMGLSGSGKSTLLRTINRLIKTIQGQIVIGENGHDIDVTNATPDALRFLRTRLVSMVFQQFALLPWRSVFDNIAFGLEISGLPKRDHQKVVEDQIDIVGLGDWAYRPVGELSGGMQQRVGLARAFATGAPILLMDEPFSALDPLIRNHLQNEMLNLQQRLNKTLVFVSHDLDEALKMGNRIAIMDDGRILQCAAPQEIVTSPANEYVANFVRHINPLNFLTARHIMRPLNAQNAKEHVVGMAKPDTSLRDLIRFCDRKDASIGIGENGRVIGVVHQSDIIHHLAEHQKR
ncbi:quaternary amine ABC transporter ATP-binding protein [Bartonella tamiae]|uniref:Choline ABC transporter, ATP-binding protein n=1 Tax=Bartonella tamiae Th239 TaxID=1094558 RepID=J0QTJ1_9HYPH|nr:ATP-binding cassette domain-containing protein [Bartonella tamiae]EJF89226.1 choline ABC transporter, ATP-binding protein [Bartonella tamiae Th239]EJF95370.1 choline ABC transporter, ATP-binding protein [Bartonella tamiae Th307]